MMMAMMRVRRTMTRMTTMRTRMKMRKRTRRTAMRTRKKVSPNLSTNSLRSFDRNLRDALPPHVSGTRSRPRRVCSSRQKYTCLSHMYSEAFACTLYLLLLFFSRSFLFLLCSLPFPLLLFSLSFLLFSHSFLFLFFAHSFLLRFSHSFLLPCSSCSLAPPSSVDETMSRQVHNIFDEVVCVNHQRHEAQHHLCAAQQVR